MGVSLKMGPLLHPQRLRMPLSLPNGRELTHEPDLDLEDIDASQLEDELNEPPEPEPQTNDPAPAPAPAQNQYNYGQPPPANNAAFDQTNQGLTQGQGVGGGPSGSYPPPAYGGVGGSGGNDAQGSGLDRIKPNDMPDEGLVDRFSTYS